MVFLEIGTGIFIYYLKNIFDCQKSGEATGV
jgi:hypothetical protein